MKFTPGNIIAAFGVIIVCAFAVFVVAMPGRAAAHPYDAPQIGDFVPGSFSCTGEIAPGGTFYGGAPGTRFAEFSGTWQGLENAKLEFVEFTANPQGPLGGRSLHVRVDDKKYDGQNVAPLAGTHGDKMKRQSVVIELEPVRADQEFGIYASWDRPSSDRVLLARWYGNEMLKCTNGALPLA